MAAGRKANTVKAPTINAPPVINYATTLSPTGETYSIFREGNTQYSTTTNSPVTQQAIDTSKQAIADIAQDLAQPDTTAIEQNAARLYQIQAQAINNQADNVVSQTSSDLSKRFGGTYNSTFGAQVISGIQDSRLKALYNAGLEAEMYGQEAYHQQQNTLINRLNTFNDYLRGQYSQSLDADALASGVLQGESRRGQDLSIQQARLQLEAQAVNKQLESSAANRRLRLLQTVSRNIIGGATSIL